MQEFINWGGETPEQLAERRRFEEEMREFAINKMLMEAARNQGKSSSATAVAAGGGGGETQFEITDTSAILVYYNSETDSYDYFTMNPASQTFTEPVSTGVFSENSNLNQVYPVNQQGYAIVFNNFDNSTTVVFVSAQGAIIESVNTVPTSDLSYDIRDGKFFYLADLDASQFVIFDGTSVRVDTDLLAGADSYSIGTDNYTTTTSSIIVRLNKTDAERGGYSEWWSVNPTASTLVLNDYPDERQKFAQVASSFHSNYLVVLDRDLYSGAYLEAKILDLTGTVVWSQEEAYDQVNYWFYGLGDSILIFARVGSDYIIKSFDPTVSMEVQDIVYSSGSQYSVKAETPGPWSNSENPPSETFAILFYDMIGDSIPGNMANVNNALMITKFQGQEAVVTELTDNYINIWDFNITNETVLLPVAVEGETVPLYKIRKATKTSAFESFVNNIEFAYDGEGAIYASSFNRVANGFLFEIAYSPAMTSFIHFIGNDGVLSADGVLPLVGIPYNDAEINWRDEAGPLLYDTPIGYYVWLPDTKKWELIEDAVGSNSYSTRNYYKSDLTDGTNYFLAKPQARLYWFSDEGTNYIDDGGNDMYDTGNMLYASTQDIQIPYTHTQLEYNGEITDQTAFVHDGQVQSGAEYGLGQASTYFTNLYPGLFVLSALNVETDQFKVDGNLGADGGGRTSTDTVQLNESGYKLYLRRVWGAGDPSVNQLIIVKATDHDAISQDFSWNTDDDFHALYNLDSAGVTEIHYLLFALADGVQGGISDITNLANDYVALIKNKTTSEEILNTLTVNHSTLLLRLPSHNPTNSSEGWIIGTGSITPFSLSPTNLDSVSLGSNGLLVLTRDASRLDNYTIDHYDLNGRLVSHIETDYPDLDIIEYVKDRAIVMLAKPVDDYTQREIFIFNEAGHQHQRFAPTNGYTFSLNDLVWWD